MQRLRNIVLAGCLFAACLAVATAVESTCDSDGSCQQDAADTNGGDSMLQRRSGVEPLTGAVHGSEPNITIPVYSATGHSDIEVHIVDPEDTETRELQVILNAPQDVQRIGELFIDAMIGAGMHLWEWVPVTDPSPGHHIAIQGNGFPLLLNYTLVHAPEEASDILKSYEHFVVTHPANATNATNTTNVTNVMNATNATNATNASLISADGSPLTLSQLTAKKKQKKNSKQLSWAAKAVSRLEGKVCLRENKVVDAVVRDVALPTVVWDWWNTYAYCTGGYAMHNMLCYEPCPDGYNGVPPLDVCLSCHGWTETLGWCYKDCDTGDLDHMKTHCTFKWCAVDTGACAGKIGGIILSFASALLNFVPAAGAMNALRKASTKLVQKGLANAAAKTAFKKAVHKAVKDVAKQLAKDAKKKLKKHVKVKGKELAKEVSDDILEQACEFLMEAKMKEEEDKQKQLEPSAMEVLGEMLVAVDPTGISDIVNAWKSDSCEEKRIEDMPDDGLVDERCEEVVNLPDGSSFEYTGEDIDLRPVYMNKDEDANNFLYWREHDGRWHVVADPNQGAASETIRSDTAGSEYCPDGKAWEKKVDGSWVELGQIQAAECTQYRFTATKLRDVHSNCVQLANFEFVNGQGTVAISSVQNPGGSNPGSEGPEKVADGLVDTKWLDYEKKPLIMEACSHGGPPTAFRFTTANDVPGRDPVHWTLEVKAGGAWSSVRTQTSASATPQARHTNSDWFCIDPAVTAGPPECQGA